MAKVFCKGTVLSFATAGTFVAIGAITSIDKTGEESETADGRTLDQSSPYVPYEPTGYVEPGELAFELFWDPALAGHQTLMGYVAQPYTIASGVLTKIKSKITYADVTPTSAIQDVAGISVDKKVAMKDMLKASFKCKLSGAPS